MGAALDFTYRYAAPSRVEASGGEKGLRLATCDADLEHPHFLEGRLRHPKQVGDMLVSLTDVVRTNYFLPRPALLDPVVTSSDSMIRFEGFSGCCGVYARVDLPASSLEIEHRERGTTNVDFNEPMRAALSRLTDSDDVRLAVGEDEVSLSRNDSPVVEKKVKLPLRWLKGFSEVQAYQPRLELAAEIDGAEARRFLRSLPTTNPPKKPSFVTPAGKGLRLTTREEKGALRVLGLHRLRALLGVVGRARRLTAWADPEARTSAWELDTDAGRFFLMLSPEVYRGFSGEGQALSTLGEASYEDVLNGVRAQLKWQNEIDAGGVAEALGIPEERVEAALVALGTRGLAGYDVRTRSYFHRELPFDLGQVESLQPRLAGARKLVVEKGVRALRQGAEESWDADVQGTKVVHSVRLRPDGDRCSCPWFSKHQGARGPCKHILAAHLAVDARDPA